jgi:uncharacterized protein YehS (DUF1456 family)
MECGDQVLRNFLNALVIHLRGTKAKSPQDVLAKHKAQIPARKDLKTDLNLKRSKRRKR